jgi:invasion protein IalB
VTQSSSSENVFHNTIVAQLSTLTTQLKYLTDSVVAMVASSSCPSSAGKHQHQAICPYCDKRGQTETDCYQRQFYIKRDADAVVSTETVVAAALAPHAPPIAGALWTLP